MSDALGSDFERGPDGLRARRFAGMAHQMQSAIARIREHVAKPLRRPSRFIAADPERDGPFVAAPLDGELGHLHPLLRRRNGAPHPESKTS